jgi:hypothetical protein
MFYLLSRRLDRKIQDVLAENRAFLLESDLIVIAVGDDTLEIWLNKELGRIKPRIHVWTEPLGLGQHALYVGGRGGCFQCLFEENADFGQVKLSSFAGSGQNFDVSIAGCGGSYIRFSVNEAIQAALMATSLSFSILQGNQTASVLVSRMGNREAFEKEGYKVSKRANIFQIDEIRKEDKFIRPGCVGCESATV